MAQPRAYTRQANFTDHTTESPSDPQVGSKLDSEFDVLNLTLVAVEFDRTDHLQLWISCIALHLVANSIIYMGRDSTSLSKSCKAKGIPL